MPPQSPQCPSRCEHCAWTLRASSCSCLGTQKVVSRGTTARRPTKSKVQIRTRCWPPPGIAEVSLAPSSPGPAPHDSIRGHRSRGGALVFSNATERQVDASGAGVLRPRGRSDALPHCPQRGAGSPPFWQKRPLLVPTLTPDPHSRGFKNEPLCRQGSPGLQPRSHPSRETPALGPRAPPGAGTQTASSRPDVQPNWNRGPQQVSKKGGLEHSQERDL